MNINKLPDKDVKKTAIFRALQLGDMLCAIPAVRAFKKAYEESEITLIGLPWAKDFVERFPRYFSSFIAFPGYPGLVEQPFNSGNFNKFLSDVNNEKFDLIIQMHGNGSVTNELVNKMDAKITAGYFKDEKKFIDENLFVSYPEEVPEIKRHLKLMEFLGVPLQGERLEFPICSEERKEFKTLCEKYGLKPKEYVCIHPGARDGKRRWSPDKFASVADMVVRNGYQVVFTGTASESKVVNIVMGFMRYSAVDLTGKTALGVLAAAVENSRLLISNDTGVSHIAAAVNTPSMVIFMASDPKRWAPLNLKLHRILLQKDSENIDYVFLSVKRMLLDNDFKKNYLKVAEKI